MVTVIHITAMIRWPLSAVAVFSVYLLLALPGTAEGACGQPGARIVATVVSVDRTVELKQASSQPAADAFRPATLKDDVCEGDSIRVGGFSRATVAFLNSGLRLTIEQNTEWLVRPPQQGRSVIQLIRGAILFFTSQPRSLDVQTPFVTAAVEGTEFLVRVVPATRTDVAVLEGAVALSNAAGNLTLTAGQSGQALAGQAPQRINVVPRDAVQWALYYPPLFAADVGAQLDQSPQAGSGAEAYVRRASALLGVGLIDEARADIATARVLDPNNGDAFALDAIIDVAQNDREGALRNGLRAVDLSPASVSARIALSYSYQASFKLEAARDELLHIVPGSADQDRPEHALALARLSELWLSLGYIDKASDAARRAVAVAGDLARAQTVLGFAELTQLHTTAAQAAFERAITVESSSPLARFGLGLTKIREGHLNDGRFEMETAAALNVNDAVIRSYLGKAYFDEKSNTLTARQFDLAKRLDPLDPTPWFYDAIQKQTINRPVEALQDLEKAISLNDNRAVYRSRFLLDQDLAARSASLGRLYRDLGFEQLAPVEGWKSLDADPGDYSGHRLLADTYSALPRHEVARVSELLQAQLLQPLSITPVPPHLAETDLFILEHAGPDEPGFNEFNPLFSRNRAALHVSGTAGNKSVLGDEATVSAVWDRLSLSAGQFHYATDGFRENNGQRRDIYNAFLQAQLSPATSVQGEFRSQKTRTGDLNLLFDPENFSRDQIVHEDSTVARVGLRHVFNPSSQVIASFYRGNRDDSLSASASDSGLTDHVNSLKHTKSWTAEVRHFFRVGRFNLTTGLGRFQSNRDRAETITVQLPFPPFASVLTGRFNDDPRQTNVYAYSPIPLSKAVTFTLGASADFYESRTFRRKQLNPKVGVTWNPIPSTVVRVAAFRTLDRALVSSQTIEPTQVSGFNQFFADAEGEEAVRYGIALDHKFSSRLFSGLEYSRRDLRIPVELVGKSGTVVRRFSRREQLGRSYFYWAPLNTISVSAEYLFEWFRRNAESAGDAQILELRTHRVPLAIRYFSATGLFAGVQATHINQNGLFFDPGSGHRGRDEFWVIDITVGYRLPMRYGRLSFQVKNLLDKAFKFQDTDPGNPLIKPQRLALLTFTLGI